MDQWELVKWLIEGVLVLAGSLIMWNVRRITGDIKETRLGLEALSREITDVKLTHVHKDEFKDLTDRLERRFDRLENIFLSGKKHEGS